jgi:hypothetical protein
MSDENIGEAINLWGLRLGNKGIPNKGVVLVLSQGEIRWLDNLPRCDG